MKYELDYPVCSPTESRSSRLNLQEATIMEEMKHLLAQCQPMLIASASERGVGKVDFNINYFDRNRELEAKRKFYLHAAVIALCALPLLTGLAFLYARGWIS